MKLNQIKLYRWLRGGYWVGITNMYGNPDPQWKKITKEEYERYQSDFTIRMLNYYEVYI